MSCAPVSSLPEVDPFVVRQLQGRTTETSPDTERSISTVRGWFRYLQLWRR